MKYIVLLLMMMFMPLGMYGQTGTQPAGNGVAGDPYLIGTADELLWYALRVNDGYGTIEGKLINDIDYSKYKDQDRYMIGNQKGVRSFNGVFDGDGYTITIGFNFQNAALDCVGLFGFVDNATIKNLNVDGTLTISGQWWHVGSIVGGDSDLDGKTRYIINCTSSVVITATKEKGTQDFVSLGGIIGCSQKGSLYMEQCGFLGNIISTSKATDNKNYRVEIGGLAGLVKSGHIYESYVYVDDSKGMTLKDEGSNNVGEYFYPLVGNRNDHSTNVVTTPRRGSNKLRNCFFAGKVNGRTPTKNSYNPPFKEWPDNINKDYPSTQPTLDQILAVIDSKATDMYIRSTEDMQRFANAVNGGNRYLNGHLRKCIEFNGTVGTSAKNYKGVFDGCGHTITVNVEGTYNCLFEYTDNATIKRINITGEVVGYNNLSSIIKYVNTSTQLIDCTSSVIFKVGYNARAYVSGLVYRTKADLSFERCAFIGSIVGVGASPSSECHGFLASNLNDSKVSIVDSYASFHRENTTGNQFIPDDNFLILTNSYSTDKTPEQYASGEVCYLLNGSTSDPSGPWYQNIGTEPNPVHAKCSCPEHAGENKVVYKNDHKECPGATTTHHSTYNNIILTGAELFDYPDHKDVDFAAGDFNCSICGDISIDSEGNYLIYNDEKLVAFAGEIAAGNMYNAKVLCDFEAGPTTTVGTRGEPYAGTFDGGYNTITLQGTPLFDYVSSATIKNLLVAGKVETLKGKNNAVGSIVSDNDFSPLTLESCFSSVEFVNNGNSKGNGNPIIAGGLIGNAKVAGWSVSNCGFAGSFQGGITKVSGIVGNPAATGYIRKSIVYYTTNNYTANSANYNTFATSSYAKLTDCYYNRTLGTATRSGETQKTAAEFSNGTVRDLLNGVNNKTVWYHYSSSNPGFDYPTIVGYVWTGAADSDWSNASNWKKGKAPVNMEAADETITIPAVAFIKKPYPTISSNVNINNLHIDPSAVVNIPAADITVNINGTVNNHGTFAINYGDAYTAVQGSPNVLISGASPINVTVKRYLKPRVTYYAGSATAEGTIQEGYDYAANGDYLAFFDAATQKFDTSLRSVGRFPAQYIGCTVGLGSYDASSFTQIGTVHNTGAMSVPLKAGYNWLSNPYPYSAMAWDNESNKGLIPQNTGADMSPTVWVRKNNGGSGYIYTTYNAKVGISAYGPGRAYDAAKYIAPFQDYCILVNNAGTYEINGVLAKDDGSVVNSKLKSAQIEMPMDVVRLNVITNGKDDIDDQAVVVLREDGILGASSFDSNKYPTSSYSQISVYKAGSNNKYAIGLYPSIDDVEGEEIPVNVTAVSGAKQLTIAADLSALAEGYDIILIDHATVPQTEVNLRLEQGYTFAASGLTAKRFGIVVRRNDSFQDSSVEDSGTSTNVVNIETKGRFVAYSMNENIIVELGSSDLGNTIQVVDLAGRVVTMIKQGKHYNVLPMTQAGIYIVVVGDQSQKVMVK